MALFSFPCRKLLALIRMNLISYHNFCFDSYKSCYSVGVPCVPHEFSYGLRHREKNLT